jgi:hypothetical protein
LPVSDPEKKLKYRKSLKQVFLSTYTIDQPNFTQSHSSETFERSLSLPPSFDTFSFPEVSSLFFPESSPHTVQTSVPNLTMAAQGGVGTRGGAPGGG